MGACTSQKNTAHSEATVVFDRQQEKNKKQVTN